MITIVKPIIAESVALAVADTLRSGWLNEGPKVKAFEGEFCRKFGQPRALAVNSGTAALHLAVMGSDVGPDDEVITPAQTFIATALAPMYAGAKAVFADILPDCPVLDPSDVERRITEKTKAIIVVHYGGYPCDMDEINAVAKRHGLSVIEDAAHALGASYKNRPVGTLGRFACYSFQAIKQLTTGDGGMLVCNDPADHETSLARRWFGINRDRRKVTEFSREWEVNDVGYKFHMNDINASMGIAQLEHFDGEQRRREELHLLYRRELATVPGVKLLVERTDRISACWLFTMLVERRVDFARAMKARGVEVGMWHGRLDRLDLFGGLRTDLPNQARFDECQISIPLRPNLTDEEVEKILNTIKQGW